MADNNNTKDDRNKLSAVWNAAPSGIGLDDKITIIENWSYEALKYLPPWIMPEAIESDGYYFVAHSRKDFKIVYTDILRLESVGVDIWYDRSMEPGRNWQEIAERMMNRQECKGVIVYGTVNSMASKPVQIELLVADRLGKNIIFINHGEDSGATAAKALYEEAKKAPGADCACVKGFEELLTRIGNADITFIDLDHSAKRKKEQLDAIKPEEVLIYKCRLSAEVTGVKYLGVKRIKIPESVTIYGQQHDVTRIGACAFANCRALEKIELPETLEEIGEHAFFGCESLTKVHLGRHVWFVAENAFGMCQKLEKVTVADDNKSIIVKDKVCYSYDYYEGDGFGIFFVPRDLKGDITLLDGLKRINPGTFVDRRWITSIAIPNSLTSIGNSAFVDCLSLASVAIGNGVKRIGSNAFYNCASLNSVTIPNSVTSIGANVFAECPSLTSVTIGNSVTSLGRFAFSGCVALASVIIGNGVKRIGVGAFDECDSLTTVSIPNGVESIGQGAFDKCYTLASVTIPNSMCDIGKNAFYWCEQLKDITYSGTVKQWRELTAKCPGWAADCPCEVVKCKDGDAPVTAEDRDE